MKRDANYYKLHGYHDEIRSNLPLPDRRSPEQTLFHTISFPGPLLRRFTITKTGRLVDVRGNDLEPDGYIEFSEPDDLSGTQDTEVWYPQREFRAWFSAGQLQTIAPISPDEMDDPYLLSSFRWFRTHSYGLRPEFRRISASGGSETNVR